MRFTLTIALTALIALAGVPDAQARTSAKRLDQCESAIRSELGAGSMRVNRVRSTDSDGIATFWLTVRHKAEAEAKSTRYRALCTVDPDMNTSVDIETGWWKAAGRGRTPVAVD